MALYRISTHDLTVTVEAPMHRKGRLPAGLVTWIQRSLLPSWEKDEAAVSFVQPARMGYPNANEYGVNAIERSMTAWYIRRPTA